MKNKKGFTLIELLAVIVVLSVVALITVPTVLGIIESSRKSSAEKSALGYIDAIEKSIAIGVIKGKVYENKEDYVYDEIEINIKGKIPTAGMYSLENNSVTNAVFCIDGYTVNYSNNKAKAGEKCQADDIKLDSIVELSSSNGQYEYPNTGTFEVVKNLSGGSLSCETLDEEVATCSISGTTVTVTPGTKKGNTTLTIKSASTSKYKEAKAAYEAITTEGLLSVTAIGYEAIYDGEAHGITVESSGATIMYGTEEGTYDLSENPTYTDVGTYTVYYQVNRPGYKTVESSKQVIINRANNTIKLSENTGTVTYPNSTTFTVTENTSGGSLSCQSSNEAAATCSISGNTVTVTPGTTAASNVNITVTSVSTTNYNAATAIYVVTSKNGTLSVTANGYSAMYDGAYHGISVTSSGATIMYGTSSEVYNLTSSPTYKDVGTYTVYYQVTKAGYQTVTDSKQVSIQERPAPSITVSGIATTWVQNNSITVTIEDSYSRIEKICFGKIGEITDCERVLYPIGGTAYVDPHKAVRTFNITSNGTYRVKVINNYEIESYKDFTVNSIDNVTPTISFNFTSADFSDGTLIYNTSYGPSGGTTTCYNTSNNNNLVSTANTIGILGDNVISCTATSGTGKTSTNATTIRISGRFTPQNRLYATGNAYIKDDIIVVDPGGTQFGPYVPMQPGCYHIWYNGENLNASSTMYDPFSGGQTGIGEWYKQYKLNYVSADSNYYVQIESLIPDFEARILNNSPITVVVRDLSIWLEGSTC